MFGRIRYCINSVCIIYCILYISHNYIIWGAIYVDLQIGLTVAAASQGTVKVQRGFLVQELPKLGQQHSQDKDLVESWGNQWLKIVVLTMKNHEKRNQYVIL